MNKAIENMEERLSTIRAGRANPNMLDNVYVSYYGDPINKEELIQLRDNKSFDDNAFAFHYSENLKDLLGWRSEEIEESEPIRHDDLHELVIIKSFLDVYNDIKK